MRWTDLKAQLRRAINQRVGLAPPAVWGKVPTQGDFVSHRAAVAEREAWQRWVEQVWPLRPQPTPSANKPKSPGQRWVPLDAVPTVRRLHEVPIAFVMPPGRLPFAPSQFVQGVLVASTDKVGRACPLIVYQKVSPAWMHRLWRQPAAADGRTLLHGWARLAWRAARADTVWSQWLTQLDGLWQLQAPGLAQWWGAPVAAPDPRRVDALMGPEREDDPARELRGVYHLPWADWPDRVLRRTDPVAAFWTQDAQGGYVQAATSLMQLWGRT